MRSSSWTASQSVSCRPLKLCAAFLNRSGQLLKKSMQAKLQAVYVILSEFCPALRRLDPRREDSLTAGVLNTGEYVM